LFFLLVRCELFIFFLWKIGGFLWGGGGGGAVMAGMERCISCMIKRQSKYDVV